MFIGHKREDGKMQSLKDHLIGVATLASGFARAFGGEDHAWRTGMLHDAGKYSEAGQHRMMDPTHTAKVDHSTAGAKIAIEDCHDGFGALAIAGHHGGMPDLGGRIAAEGDGTLKGRIKKDLSGKMDYISFWEENEIDTQLAFPRWLDAKQNPFALTMYARMLFSCLVDADFLDTERFMQEGKVLRSNHDDMTMLWNRLEAHVKPWLENPHSEINRKRCDILCDCIRAGEEGRGVYTLTVPTGGGKTISSLAFALNHAIKNGHDRIIYVIPYTSIIEQNAAVFKGILGEDNVIEHHSAIDYASDLDIEMPDVKRRMLATENWDAPVIVTTAVQFFESLFANKPDRCRKLHNIANSVVIFDEVQMLPLPYLKPCVSAIAELAVHYQVTAVLCTATQPSLNRMFSAYSKEIVIREICDKTSKPETVFRRVHFEKRDKSELSELACQLAQRQQVLCIVNTRRTAQAIFALLPDEGSFHLSTRMTPDHRTRVLKQIRGRLKDGKPCRVISTSLIEAGVDVNFPEVWREMAGLDSILQAAGRCNREGRRSSESSAVVIFSLTDGVPRGIQPNAAATEAVLGESGCPDDYDTIRRYFEILYWQRGDEALDEKAIMSMCPSMKLQSIAEAFRFIETDTRTIYIPTEENDGDLNLLRKGAISRSLMRRLNRSAVDVFSWEMKLLEENGQLERCELEYGILADASAYDDRCGLVLDSQMGVGLWI